MDVIIIEDEELAANRLEAMIKKYDKNINVLAKLESVAEAVNWFSSNDEPDLIFLDIHLEDGLSFGIFERVDVSSPIIFTTAFDEYAIKAFKLKSIDYLLKPITQEELNQALEKYKNWHRPEKAPVTPENEASPATVTGIDLQSLYALITKKEPQYKSRFSITIGQKIKTFSVDEIAYFYAEEGVVLMVTNQKAQYPIDYSLDQLTGQLDPQQFFRINRQFLIKISAVENVVVYPKSKLKVVLNPPLTANKEVFVSIDKVARFKEWLDK